jgi:hypothetical protein
MAAISLTRTAQARPRTMKGLPYAATEHPRPASFATDLSWFAAAYPWSCWAATKIALAFTVFLTTSREPPTPRSMEALCV